MNGRICSVLVQLAPTLLDLTIDGEQIETTSEHPFFTQERGWVNAGELHRGEHVRTAEGGHQKCVGHLLSCRWVRIEPPHRHGIRCRQAAPA